MRYGGCGVFNEAEDLGASTMKEGREGGRRDAGEKGREKEESKRREREKLCKNNASLPSYNSL